MKRSLWIVLSVVGVAVLVAAVLVVEAHLHSPAHSLTEVQQALATHDRNLFYEYVDADSLLSRAADDASGAEAAGSDDLENGMLALLKPNLVKSLQEQVDHAVDGGDSPQAQAMRATLEEVFSSPVVSVTSKGGVASIVFSIRLRHAKADSHLELGLHEADGHLKFCEIKNLAQLISDARKAESDWEMAQDVAVYKSLGRAVTFKSFSVQGFDDPNTDEEYFIYTAKIQNESDDSVTDIHARVFFRDNANQLLERDDVLFSHGAVPPHSTKVMTYKRDVRSGAADWALYEHGDRYRVGSVTPFSAVVGGQVLAFPFPDRITEK